LTFARYDDGDVNQTLAAAGGHAMASSDAVRSNGRKRRRDQYTDEGAVPSVQLADSKAKDLYLAMKAACSAKRYSDAVNICSEALHEERMLKSTRVQFLLARSSIYSKMDDSFSMAIKDAKQAILLIPTHAMVSDKGDTAGGECRD
jgi:hypothetical protein